MALTSAMSTHHFTHCHATRNCKFIISFFDFCFVLFFCFQYMRVSVQRQRSPEELQQLLDWQKVRGMFFDVFVKVKSALELAAGCNHPDAAWLTKLFAGRKIKTRKEATQVLLRCENDPRALCFAALLADSADELRRAADLGDAYAQARMAGRTTGDECFRWGEKAAAQGECDGFYVLAWCYRAGEGCGKDYDKSAEMFLIAAQLGKMESMIMMGHMLGVGDPQKVFWFAKAAENGTVTYFLTEMHSHMEKFIGGTGNARAVFAIGRALKGHIDNEKRTIFCEGYKFDTYIGPANQAFHFYEFQLQSYRKAVDNWTIVGLRNKVVKDIRLLIGKMIWESRAEAKYVAV
jgi:hypothetical protein